jgi:hypothetical protein
MTRLVGVFVVLAAALFAYCAPAHAAQFEIVSKSCPDDDWEKLNKLPAPPKSCNTSTQKLKGGRIAVRIKGEIAAGDAGRLEQFLAIHVADVASYGYRKGGGTYVTVYMAGEAGDVDAAMELGRFLKDNGVRTRIAHDAVCAGACALAFMGGRENWGRLTRTAVERRLEAGGRLVFRSPLDVGAGADAVERLRARIASLQSYAAHVDIPPLVLAKIVALKSGESFPIDNVFWAKIAGIIVTGLRPATAHDNDAYIYACQSQADWEYGMGGALKEPPHLQLKNDDGNWTYGDLHRDKGFVIVAVVYSFSRWDYWCAFNTTRHHDVTLKPAQVRDILKDYAGGHSSLLARIYGDDIVLKPNQIYFSKAQNDFADTRAQNGFDLLSHKPETRLADIADPHYKWNPWSDWDPWFDHDAP